MTGFKRVGLAAALALAALAGCETEPQVLGVEVGVDVAGDVAEAGPDETLAELPGGEVASLDAIDLAWEVPPSACLALIPADVVGFSMTAPRLSTQRTLTLRNDGQDAITVTSLALDATQDPDGEFSINPDAAFPPTTGEGPGTVLAYAAVPVTMTFTHKQTGSSQHQTTLTVTTTVPGCETVSVVLNAAGEWWGPCTPVVVPDSLLFPTISFGDSLTLTVMVHNKGPGNCSFGGAAVEDCPPATMQTDATCPSPFNGAASSSVFELVSLPPSTMNGIGPGMSAPIKLKFTLKDATPIRALLAVKVIDDNIPGSPQEIILPVSSGSGADGNPVWKPNLTGVGATPGLSVLPAEVDLGSVAQGCWGPTRQVCVYGTGSAPAVIDAVDAVGCSPEFKLKDVPVLPATVGTGAPLCFTVAYAPQDPEKDACWVAVSSGGVVVATVPLAGQGVAGPIFTDTFTQVSVQPVDLLFVIDDSGSMGDDQDRLKAAFAKFAANSPVWQGDFHAGVVSTNLLSARVSGRLNRGDPGLPVRYVTKDTPDAANVFKGLADVGCDDCPAWASCDMTEMTGVQESGLEAARRALGAPLETVTDVACVTDADCQVDLSLCGSALTCPYACAGGHCAGWNAGFSRDDAQLEIFVISNKDDGGLGLVDEYVTALKNIKGYDNPAMMHFNAVVGPDGGCPAGSTVTAEAGARYSFVAQQTNGTVRSFCDADLWAFDSVGSVDFQNLVMYFLSKLADPTTVKVMVDGTECLSGWKFDAPSNRVIFDSQGSCAPAPGSKIEVTYSTLCLAS